MKALPRIALAVVVAAAAGLGGYLAYGRLARPEQEAVRVAPAPAAPQPETVAPAERRVAEVVPDVSLPDRSGTVRSLTEWKGQPLLINFWATWCAPCRKEIPLLMSLRQARSAEGLEVIGIAVDEREAVLKYAAEIGMDYPILIGEKEGMDAANAFGVPLVFPFSVFADRQGRIVTVKIGELHAEEADLILDRLREVDSGRLSLEAAQRAIEAGLRDLAAERARAGAGGTGARLDPA